MEQSISILFYLRLIRKTKDNLAPIYFRVTINGQRFEQTTNRFVDPDKWLASAGKVKGNGQEAREINNYLDSLKYKAQTIELELFQTRKEINITTFKNKWLGITDKEIMILDVFKKHNEEVEQLIGKDFASGTLIRYKTSLMHTQSFINYKFKVDDLEVTKLNYDFISSYAHWLKSVRNCNHNSTMKYLANFKKIVLICLKNGWLNKDPFIGFKLAKKEVERPYLTPVELNAISIKEFPTERLNLVKDIFIFSCYTGLAYADVQKLKRTEIGIGVDGNKWIFTSRQKTDTSSRIPLLPKAEQLIEKYNNHPQCLINGRLLPILSNQKMNAYLKEIADTCGITKNLTFHIARHTFATTVTLSNGVPIETVSKMLGHKNLRTTQHYAKILDMKVSNDMQLLREKFNEQSENQQPQ